MRRQNTKWQDDMTNTVLLKSNEKLREENEQQQNHIQSLEYDLEQFRQAGDEKLREENVELKKGIRHIKKWCGSTMAGMTVYDMAGAIKRMCSDLLSKP